MLPPSISYRISPQGLIGFVIMITSAVSSQSCCMHSHQKWPITLCFPQHSRGLDRSSNSSNLYPLPNSKGTSTFSGIAKTAASLLVPASLISQLSDAVTKHLSHGFHRQKRCLVLFQSWEFQIKHSSLLSLWWGSRGWWHHSNQSTGGREDTVSSNRKVERPGDQMVPFRATCSHRNYPGPSLVCPFWGQCI